MEVIDTRAYTDLCCKLADYVGNSDLLKFNTLLPNRSSNVILPYIKGEKSLGEVLRFRESAANVIALV